MLSGEASQGRAGSSKRTTNKHYYRARGGGLANARNTAPGEETTLQN